MPLIKHMKNNNRYFFRDSRFWLPPLVFVFPFPPSRFLVLRRCARLPFLRADELEEEGEGDEEEAGDHREHDGLVLAAHDEADC